MATVELSCVLQWVYCLVQMAHAPQDIVMLTGLLDGIADILQV